MVLKPQWTFDKSAFLFSNKYIESSLDKSCHYKNFRNLHFDKGCVKNSSQGIEVYLSSVYGNEVFVQNENKFLESIISPIKLVLKGNLPNSTAVYIMREWKTSQDSQTRGLDCFLRLGYLN